MIQSSKVLPASVLIQWMKNLNHGWAFRTCPSSATLGHYSVISFQSQDVAMLWFSLRGDGVPVLNYMETDGSDNQSVLMPNGWDSAASFSAVMVCVVLQSEKLQDLLPYTRGKSSTVRPTQEEKTRLRSKIQKGFRRSSFQRDRGPFPQLLVDAVSSLCMDYKKILEFETGKIMSEVEEKMKVLAASGIDEQAIVGLWRSVLIREAMEA